MLKYFWFFPIQSLRNEILLCNWLKMVVRKLFCGANWIFFPPGARLGSQRPWWFAKWDKIYQVVHESKMVEIRCFMGWAGIEHISQFFGYPHSHSNPIISSFHQMNIGFSYHTCLVMREAGRWSVDCRVDAFPSAMEPRKMRKWPRSARPRDRPPGRSSAPCSALEENGGCVLSASRIHHSRSDRQGPSRHSLHTYSN